MIVPGTTISVTLVLGYIELRDKGIIQKKVKIRNKSFDEVLKEVEAFFKIRGKRIAPGILRETLIRIGVPEARAIMVEAPEETSETEETKMEKQLPSDHQPEVQPSSQKMEMSLAPSDVEMTGSEKIVPAAESTTATEHSFVVSVAERKGEAVAAESSTVTIKDTTEAIAEPKVQEKIQSLQPSEETLDIDFIEALETVERLSDEFEPESPREKTPKLKIRVELEGAEELKASKKTHAIDSDVFRGHSVPKPEAEVVESGQVAEGSKVVMPVSEVEKETKHIIKPIVTAKAIIVGEEGVGKRSLILMAKMHHPVGEDNKEVPYIYENVFELETHRVKLQTWCFDDAAEFGVSRKTYYEQTGVAIIVYSIADRWSFDSVDFWVKEVTNSVGYMPPLILAGNKVDLRSKEESLREPPVSTEEGFGLAETLASELGTDKNLHPVGFVETSCLTGQGVKEVFLTAAKLWLKNLSERQPNNNTSK